MKAEIPHQHLSFSPNLIDIFLLFIFLFLLFATVSQLPQAMVFAQTGVRPGVTTSLDLALRIIRDSSLLGAAIISTALSFFYPAQRSYQFLTLFLIAGFMIFSTAAIIIHSNLSIIFGNFRFFLLFLLTPGIYLSFKKEENKSLTLIKYSILIFLLLQCITGYYNLIFADSLYSKLSLIGKKSSGSFSNFNAFSASAAGAIILGSVVLHINKQSRFSRWCSALIVLTIPLIIASGSRTGMIATAIVLIGHTSYFKRRPLISILMACCTVPLLLALLNSPAFTGRYTGDSRVIEEESLLKKTNALPTKSVPKSGQLEIQVNPDNQAEPQMLGRKNIWISIIKDLDLTDYAIGKGFGGYSSASSSIKKNNLESTSPNLNIINPHGFVIFLIGNYGLFYSLLFSILIICNYYHSFLADPVVIFAIGLLCIPYNFHEMVPGALFALLALEALKRKQQLKTKDGR